MSISTDDIQTLLDERAITQVALTYCWALDTRNWALLDQVFMPDATAELGGTKLLVGIEAIRTRVNAALERLDISQHLVGNHVVAVAGDMATHRCYLQAQHVRQSAVGGPNYIVAGRYEDRLVRTVDGWRIEHRTLVVMWTEGNLGVIHGD